MPAGRAGLARPHADLWPSRHFLRPAARLSTQEAATLLAIRPETVKTRLHRARRLLRLSIERMLLK